MTTPSMQLTGRADGLARFSGRAAAGSVFWTFAQRTAAALLLLLLLPLLVVILAAVALASRESPLIAHRRVGRHGQEFWMLKVRTMWNRESPAARSWTWIEFLRDTHVPVFKRGCDPRVTSPLARFLRRSSLDELPQLIHVIAGSMLLVGPRPITRAEWDEHYGASAQDVLSVLPGMTGLWQVSGGNRLTYAQRRRLDLFYARRRSARLDLALLSRTPTRVFSGRGAG
jgi:lipopolysaccharide/colanic/teichoic acid biosynthesis glycosyltransferase